jgi:[acyl-carrier-protein] S-malonyltransferase
MMTVVGLEDDALKKMMPEGVSIANQLFPKGRVLSGSKDGLQAVEDAVKEAKIAGSKTIVQPVSGAFHSPFMATAAEKLGEALAAATFRKPARVVYSNVDGLPHADDADAIKRRMKAQLTAGVMWQDTIDHIGDLDAFYEPAPGKQLASMMRRIDAARHAKMRSI